MRLYLKILYSSLVLLAFTSLADTKDDFIESQDFFVVPIGEEEDDAEVLSEAEEQGDYDIDSYGVSYFEEDEEGYQENYDDQYESDSLQDYDNGPYENYSDEEVSYEERE